MMKASVNLGKDAVVLTVCEVGTFTMKAARCRCKNKPNIEHFFLAPQARARIVV